MASGATRGHPRASLALLVLLKRRKQGDFVVFKEDKQTFHRLLSTENGPAPGATGARAWETLGRGDEESRASLTLSEFRDMGRCPHTAQETVETGRHQSWGEGRIPESARGSAGAPGTCPTWAAFGSHSGDLGAGRRERDGIPEQPLGS